SDAEGVGRGAISGLMLECGRLGYWRAALNAELNEGVAFLKLVRLSAYPIRQRTTYALPAGVHPACLSITHRLHCLHLISFSTLRVQCVEVTHALAEWTRVIEAITTSSADQQGLCRHAS